MSSIKVASPKNAQHALTALITHLGVGLQPFHIRSIHLAPALPLGGQRDRQLLQHLRGWEDIQGAECPR